MYNTFEQKMCDTVSIISVCHVRVIIDNLINGKSINGPISMVMALVFYVLRYVMFCSSKCLVIFGNASNKLGLLMLMGLYVCACVTGRYINEYAH